MVATHIRKIKHSMLCVTGVHLRDLTNTSFVNLQMNLVVWAFALPVFFVFEACEQLYLQLLTISTSWLSMEIGLGAQRTSCFVLAIFSSRKLGLKQTSVTQFLDCSLLAKRKTRVWVAQQEPCRLQIGRQSEQGSCIFIRIDRKENSSKNAPQRDSRI